MTSSIEPRLCHHNLEPPCLSVCLSISVCSCNICSRFLGGYCVGREVEGWGSGGGYWHFLILILLPHTMQHWLPLLFSHHTSPGTSNTPYIMAGQDGKREGESEPMMENLS